MLLVLTVIIVLAVGAAYFYEGLFTAVTMCINVVIAGLVAFNFWEPLADGLTPMMPRFVLDYLDFVLMIGIFALVLGVLRTMTNQFANRQLDFNAMLLQFGGAAVGLFTGYLVSGFFICALQTLPWPEQQFLDFEPWSAEEAPYRRYVPADRFWLVLMYRAGAYPFANREVATPASDSRYDSYETFDRFGAFEANYMRYRRGPTPSPFGSR